MSTHKGTAKTATTCRHCGAAGTRDFLCRACLHRVKVSLLVLPSLAIELETTASRQARGAASAGARGSDMALPYDELAAAQRATLGVLTAWAVHITNHDRPALVSLRSTYGTPNAPLRPPQSTQTRQAVWSVLTMLDHLSWFATDVQGPNAASAVFAVRAKLRHVVDRVPMRWYVGPCDAPLETGRCQLDLYATPLAAVIVCDGHRSDAIPGAIRNSGCGAMHDAAQRRDWLVAQLQDELVELEPLLDALPTLIDRDPDKATVRQWRARKRLVPHGETNLGVSLYRGGDVLGLALDELPRTGWKRRDIPPRTA